MMAATRDVYSLRGSENGVTLQWRYVGLYLSTELTVAAPYKGRDQLLFGNRGGSGMPRLLLHWVHVALNDSFALEWGR